MTRHDKDCERCYWRGRAEAAEAKVARVEALPLGECEEYPGDQTCITAGPQVLAAEGCLPCRVRAALAGPAEPETSERP